MKLSAPPPPPPEPPEPSDPTSPGDPQPDGAGSAGEATHSDAGKSPAPGTPPVAQAATWPTWFPQADVALVGLAVALGFLVASFTARNADAWLHLATGKRLVSGQYTLGIDPFSYTGTDRTWVNHSWLWDLGAYLLYSGDGMVLLVVKALAVALAGALLIAIRRPGFPLWPWAAFTAIAFVAAAPRLTFNPLIGSMVLLAATLFVLFRVPHRPGSWRTPLIIGGIFWLWANVDAWFILGPFTLSLLVIGQWLQVHVLNRAEPVIPEEEPLGPLPDMRTLLMTLGLGVVACMLNPHHVLVWELPFELAGSDVIKPDPTMNIGLNLAPTDQVYLQRDFLGWNVNGAAYGFLLLVGGAVLGFGAGRLRTSHLVLWIGFALMSLISVFAIPFFALVAVPLVAGQLNAISSRITLGKKSEQGTRLLLLGSGGGRVLCLLGLLVACACSWVGWMHPKGLDGGIPRRAAWSIEAEPGLVNAAKQLQVWRESGELPEETRGFIASITLADYCAWFAPDEKVYINSRFNHHRPELPDYVTVRGALWVYTRLGEPPNQKAAAEVLKQRGASYVALYDSRRQIAPSGITNLPTLRRMGFPIPDPTVWDILGWDDWATWYQDGRALVFGWRPGFAKDSPTYNRLRLDPVFQAFGPGVERLPVATVTPLPGPRTWIDDFTTPSRNASPAADEALGWLEYKRELGRGQMVRTLASEGLFMGGTPAPHGFNAHSFALRGGAGTGRIPGPTPDGAFEAIPILAFRAARRAIAANPDHPDGYFALALALRDADLPLTDGERTVWQIAALRQCLDRLPPPDQYRPGVYAASPTLAADLLARLYVGAIQNKQPAGIPLNLRPMPDPLFEILGLLGPIQQGQRAVFGFVPLDLALLAQQQAADYAKREFIGLPEQIYKAIVDGEEGQVKMLDREVRTRLDTYTESTRDRPLGVKDRHALALRLGLVGEAIRLLRETPDLEKEFGQTAPIVALQRIAEELFVGRVEDATADMAVIRDEIEKADPGDRMIGELRARLRLLEYHQSVITGNYAVAGTILEDMLAEGIAKRPTFPSPAEMSGMGRPLAILPPSGIEGIVNFAAQERIHFAVTEQTILSRLNLEAAFYTLRGFLSLLEGDIGAAKQRFRQTVRDAPAEWTQSKLQVGNPRALGYLELIKIAEQRAPKK